MAFIPVLNLAEAKKFLALTPPSAPVLSDEDNTVTLLAEAVAEEIRGMLNLADDVAFAAVVGNPKVRHVAFEMIQWYWAQTKKGGDRLGMTSIADTMPTATSTTTLETAQVMGDRWRRELRQFRVIPL